MGRILFTLAAAMIGVACVIGCACGPPVERQLETAFDAFKDLGVAVEAYRAGSGRWPNSPDELRRSPGLAAMVGLDRYKNLRFEPQPDGGLTISFDEWAAPGRTIVARSFRLTIGATAPTTGPSAPGGEVSPAPSAAPASTTPTSTAPASTAPASTEPTVAGPTTRKTAQQRKDEAVAHAKGQAYARAYERMQRGMFEAELPDPKLIGALAEGYFLSPDIAHFRLFLAKQHPHLQWDERIGSDEFADRRAATRPAPAPVGYLSIRLTQQGDEARVEFDPVTGKLKGFAVPYPQGFRVTPLPPARGRRPAGP